MIQRRRWWMAALACCAAYAQPAPGDLRFEVASLKAASPTSAGRNGGGPGTADPGFIRYGRVTLKGLIGVAYGVDQQRIQGPAWMATDNFTVEAKVPPGATREQVNIMLRNLLHDRFQLTLHIEPTKLPAYGLTIAKGGVRIKASIPKEDDPPPNQPVKLTSAKDANGFPILTPGRHYQAAFANGIERAAYRDISMAEFVSTLQYDITPPTRAVPFEQTRIVDQTGLTGTYDFTLEFRLKFDQPDTDVPDAFTALEKQLGLRLQKGEFVTLDVVVIDHVERTPLEN